MTRSEFRARVYDRLASHARIAWAQAMTRGDYDTAAMQYAHSSRYTELRDQAMRHAHVKR